MEPIAIIGMSCFFPDATDIGKYWDNIISNKCFIKEIEKDLWDINDFYSSDPKAEDKTYCKMGAKAPSIVFNPLEYGMTPKIMQSTAVEQIYGLAAARSAMLDAGILNEGYDHSKTGVIVSASIGKPLFRLCHRTEVPKLKKILDISRVPEKQQSEIIKRYKDTLDDWTEASNPGTLSNVVAGRIAHCFDLKGTSLCVDAACASGLAAVKMAIDELQNKNNDIMIAGGANLDLSPNTFISFSKTPALSKTNKIKPFDADADGMLLGDGVGMVVLKRLSDAERDNDRIYATIIGVGSSSDGASDSIYSPSKEGQQAAIERAWKSCGITGDSIDLFEAHGTGTAVGDKCEIESLSEMLSDSKSNKVVGSVKGQIGHLRLAAGIASLIKVALALNNEVYPPSIPVNKLNPVFDKSPLRPIDKPLPWIKADGGIRRAAASAFGFGGTNYHVILEEYKKKEKKYIGKPVYQKLFESKTYDILISKISEFVSEKADRSYVEELSENKVYRLGFTADSQQELFRKAEAALEYLKTREADKLEREMIYYSEGKNCTKDNVAIMFPGQGTQRIDMVNTLACESRYIKQNIESADRLLINKGMSALSEVCYPIDRSEESVRMKKDILNRTNYTQVLLAAVNGGIYSELKDMGVNAAYYLGHSFGEIIALWAAGIIDDDVFINMSFERGSAMDNNIQTGYGMAAIIAEKDTVDKLIAGNDKVVIANINSDTQYVISGPLDDIEKIKEYAQNNGIKAVILNVAGAFHSKYIAGAKKEFKEYLEKELSVNKSDNKVISNIDADFYKSNKKDVITRLTDQLISPVEFKKCVIKAYDSGVRVFVESGVGKVLSNLVRNILKDKDDVRIITICPNDETSKYGIADAAMKLAVLGLPVIFDANPKFITSDKKSEFVVDSQYFYLNNKIRKMNDAMMANNDDTKSINDDTNSLNNKTDKGDIPVMKNEMSNCITNEIHKDSFELFMENQSEKMKGIVGVLDSLDGSNEKIYEKICNFAEQIIKNDAETFKYYLDCQERIILSGKGKSGYTVPDVKRTVQVKKDYEKAVEVQSENKAEVIAESRPEPKAEPDSIDGSPNEDLKENIVNKIIESICEITGFDADIIETDMDVKQDLGFDSIQIVEFYSLISQKLGVETTEFDVDELGGMNKISEISNYIFEKLK